MVSPQSTQASGPTLKSQATNTVRPGEDPDGEMMLALSLVSFSKKLTTLLPPSTSSSPGRAGHTGDEGVETDTVGRRCDTGLGSAVENKQPVNHPRVVLGHTEI